MSQIHTIGDPWQNVNLFFFQHADDTRELSTAVPAGADRYLIPMKMGIIDHDRFLGQSNENQAAGGRNQKQTARHGLRATRRIEYNICQFAVGMRRRTNADACSKAFAPFVLFNHVHIAARDPGKLCHSQANWSGPNHQHRFSWLQIAPDDRMRANSQSLDQGKLFEREFFRFIQERYRNVKQILHASINVNSDHLYVFATIGMPDSACTAFAATNIGFDCTMISHIDAGFIGAYLHNLSRQLMSQDSRIGIDGMLACKSVKIASTNPHFENAEESL